MNDFDPIDLSPLDPAREPERWARLLAETRLRLDAVLDARMTPVAPLDIVQGWTRPLLAAAAVLVALLGGAWAALGHRTPVLEHASESRRLAVLSDYSIGRGQRPTGAQLLVALRSRSAP